MKNDHHLSFAGIVFTIALLISTGIIYTLTQQDIEHRRERALMIASGHAYALQHHLQQALSVTDALAVIVRHEKGIINDFDSLAKEMLNHYSGADAIALEPNGVIESIYPKQSNQAAIGLNLLQEPHRKTEALLARDNQQLTLAGPFELVQGGLGALGFKPVFLDDEQGKAQFWGFTNVVIRLPEALGIVPFDELEQLGYDHALWRINPSTQQQQIIHQSASLPMSTVDAKLSIANANWTLSIAPKQGWINPSALLTSIMTAIVISLLLAYVTQLLLRIRHHEQRLEEDVAQKTEAIQSINTELHTMLGSYQRLTKIYAALSLCNQAIAHTNSEEELFPIICRDAVTYGGMQMAWIGILDEDHMLRPVASFGSGTHYLDGIRISIDGTLDIGKGPTGTAMRENRAYWCQDFQHNPDTITWHERGAKFGWAASAALPLQNQGKVIGALTLYSQAINAFDEPAQNLLLEMATAISTALDRFRLAQANKNSEDRIQYLAHFDQLTGLPNRILLQDRFQYAMNITAAHQTQLAIILFDLDHFKTINDTLGHSIGDQILITISKRLQAIMLEEDTLSRMGGDEFVFILPHADSTRAAAFAAQLQSVISEPYQLDSYELNLSASIGIALYPDNGTDFETLLKNADAAMYLVKHSTRNAFQFFAPEMNASAARTLALINALTHAIDRNEFHLVYQPQIKLDDNTIIGAEALLRWHHPIMGNISPAEFIPIAEKGGQIIAIGEWVLRTAIKQMKDWQNQGMLEMIIAVNLSAIQFRHPNLTDVVTNTLDTFQLAHSALELELTESVAMHAPQTAIAIMDKLNEQGIRMSIDDFGTGYSSLSYLKKFKTYKLKIDQSFVRDLNNDPEDQAIVSAIISLANSLGLITIAEGVETTEQLAFLRQQGCGEVQGYYFSKPLNAHDFERFVEQYNRGSTE